MMVLVNRKVKLIWEDLQKDSNEKRKRDGFDSGIYVMGLY